MSVTRLREWRLAAGLTLEDVHGLSGVSIPHLSLVERGKTNMSATTKVRLARSLDVRVADLFEPDTRSATS